PRAVRGDWLALFETGEDLAPLTVPNAGAPVKGQDFRAGAVIHPTGSPASELYVLTADGALAPLTPLAHRLYLLSDADAATPVDGNPSEIAQLPTAKPAGGADWPSDTLAPTAQDGPACATLTGGKSDQRTTLAARSTAVSST